VSGSSRALFCSWVGLIVVGAAAPPARAADDPMVQCIAASDKGLDLRKQGKLIEARAVLATCAAATCGADISGVCQKRLADISAALPSIVFLPKDGAGNDVAGVKLYVDGASPGETLDGRPLPLDPGPHSFRFEAAGQPPVERSFVLVEGAKSRQERIDLALPPSALTPVAPPIAASAPEPPRGTQKAVGLVVGGVGLLGVGVASVLGLMASSSWSASKNDCGSPTSCPNHARAVSEHDMASSEGVVSTVAFVAGGAALATAAFLLLTAPHESSPAAMTGRRLQLAPSAGPGGASLSVLGTF